jgi:hypothetical protein
MSKSKKKRWSCPLCGVGVLGPLRPRKENAVRYCLPCTGEKGWLVKRVCPSDISKDKAAQERKTAAQERRKANPKPRRTKRSWMRDKRYVHAVWTREFNMMEIAEKMCASKKWNSVVQKALDDTGVSMWRSSTANRTMKDLWDRTMKAKGKRGTTGAIRISRGSWGNATGRGGDWYGVTMKTSDLMADNLVTLLHELCHVAHLSQVSASEVNGKRRPHDLTFNLIMCRMAKAFWGYDFHPFEAGYSVGRGYAPTFHLEKWLDAQLKEGNPNVLKWGNGKKTTEKTPTETGTCEIVTK